MGSSRSGSGQPHRHAEARERNNGDDTSAGSRRDQDSHAPVHCQAVRPAKGYLRALTAAAWPKKLAEQIAAVRDLVAKGTSEWAMADVAAAFKGAKKADVEEVLDGLAALGHLAAYETGKTRRSGPSRGGA